MQQRGLELDDRVRFLPKSYDGIRKQLTPALEHGKLEF